MNGRPKNIIFACALVTISVAATFLLFDTTFSRDYIDWISYAAAIFLVYDGFTGIRRQPDDHTLSRGARMFRIFIGVCVLTVHLIQHVWGTDAAVFSPGAVETVIDWSAFFFGIFLIAEGFFRILLSASRDLSRQLRRFVRVLTGGVIFTIHLIQFTRY
jgi:hypothetical protein